MSYLLIAPEMVSVAAGDLARIGSVIGAANSAAEASTTGLLAAGADEVSAAIAELFSSHGQAYQSVSAQAEAFQRLGAFLGRDLEDVRRGERYRNRRRFDAAVLTYDLLTAGKVSRTWRRLRRAAPPLPTFPRWGEGQSIP